MKDPNDAQPVTRLGGDPVYDLLRILVQRTYTGEPPVEVLDLLSQIKPKTKRFVTPTVNEIAEYMKELSILDADKNAEKFFNHYKSKDWKVGKSSMKDWKAAVRTWDLPKTQERRVTV